MLIFKFDSFQAKNQKYVNNGFSIHCNFIPGIVEKALKQHLERHVGRYNLQKFAEENK